MSAFRTVVPAALAAALALLAAGPAAADPPPAEGRPTDTLIEAVHLCDAQRAGQALERGADPNLSRPEGSVFSLALACPDPGIARLLLDHGLDPKQRDRQGYDGLLLAVQAGRVDLVQLLLARGAEANTALPDAPAAPADHRARPGSAARDSALLMAVRNKKTEIAYLLLEAGADPNRPGEGGDAPLYLAVQKKQMDVARLLLERGADANVKKEGKPVLLEALREREMLILLLEHEADLNAGIYDPYDKSGSGETALHLAVSRRDKDLVNYLLAAGADPAVRDTVGDTPLDLAVAQEQNGRGNPEIVRMLQEAAGRQENP